MGPVVTRTMSSETESLPPPGVNAYPMPPEITRLGGRLCRTVRHPCGPSTRWSILTSPLQRIRQRRSCAENWSCRPPVSGTRSMSAVRAVARSGTCTDPIGARDHTVVLSGFGKWWLGDTASGTCGGVYLFASQHDADRSRETDLFRDMFANPALKDITVREYDVLDAPTAITAPTSQADSAPQETR